MDRFKIKVLMVIFLILGCIAKFIPHTPFILNYPGTLVMPVAIFLVVEGYYYTSSREQYLRRMMIGGEIMLIGNFLLSLIFMTSANGRIAYSMIDPKTYGCLAFMIIITVVFLILNLKNKCLNDGAIIIFIFIMAVGNLISLRLVDNRINLISENLFISLAGILVLLKALDESRENKVNKTLVKVLIVFSVCLLTQTLIIGPFFALVIYMFRNNKRMIATGLFVLSGLFIPGFTAAELLAKPQWMMFFGIIFILLYNKEEGLKIKKPFYYIYPLVVWGSFIIGSIIR